MEYLTKPELRKLFEIAYKRNKTHHLAMVMQLWHGLRVSELINIKGTDIYDGQLSVKRLKRSKETLQPIYTDLSDPIFDASPVLKLAEEKKDQRLFPFCRQRVDQFIKKYGEEAGIHPSKRHSHAVGKHSIAMMLWDEKNSLGEIQSYLGHKSSGSTLCYLHEADARKAQNTVSRIRI